MRVAVRGTERVVWPGTAPVQRPTSDADVLLTAWLRPPPGNALDPQRAQQIASLPPRGRTYAERAALRESTNADAADVARFCAYCESVGLRAIETHWRSVVIGGSLPNLIETFGANVAVHVDGAGQRFRHRSGPITVPESIAAIVHGVFGLHQWPRSRRLGSLGRHVDPLKAKDVAARYAFPDGDGSGQTIGIIQCRGSFKPDDFDRCMNAQGLKAAHPLFKRIDNAALAHKNDTTKDLESALDSQVIAALAPGARIVLYQAPDDERGFLDAIRTAIFDQEYAPSILSISYGWPEMLWTPVALQILNDLFVAAAMLGISVFCSSGDNGAELDYDGSPHVLAPASSPFVHACGATTIESDANGEREVPWEQSGGGYSEVFPASSWQQAGHGRSVPDVAAQVRPGYCVYLDGVELAMGGTSAVAPMWAALAARINQRLGRSIGLIAPLLYQSPELFRNASGWNPRSGLGVPIGSAIEAFLR